MNAPAVTNLRATRPADKTAPPEAAKRTETLVLPRARYVVGGTVAGALALAAAYFVGHAEGSAKVEATEQKVELTQASFTQSTTTLKQELAEKETRIAQLEARRRLHQALLALEQDNFGTARRQLEQAHKLLKDLAPPPGSKMEELILAVASVNLGVSADSSLQKEQLRGLAALLDDLLG